MQQAAEEGTDFDAKQSLFCIAKEVNTDSDNRSLKAIVFSTPLWLGAMDVCFCPMFGSAWYFNSV